MRLLSLLIVLAAPAGTHELRYRFTKGMQYSDQQSRTWVMQQFVDGKVLVTRAQFASELERTILEVDKTEHPSIERVFVKKFRLIMEESPDSRQKIGVQPNASEGKTYVWRRMKKRWRLFTDENKDVTDDPGLRDLLDQLRNWRDARLPKQEVGVGSTWEIPAEDYMETTGLVVPKGTTGVARFEVAAIEAGTAGIKFDYQFQFRQGKQRASGKQSGTWQFDIGRGRDLSFDMKGSIDFDGGKAGHARITLQRRVTYR